MASPRFFIMKMLYFMIHVLLFQPTSSIRLALKPTVGSEVVCRSEPTTNYQLNEVSEQYVMDRKPEAVSKLHYVVLMSGFGLDEQMRTLMDKSKPCVNTMDPPVSKITVFHDDANNINIVYYHSIKNVSLRNQSISLDFFGSGQTMQYGTSSTVLKTGNGNLILQRLCGIDNNITIVTILSTDSDFPIGNLSVMESVKRELEMDYNITLSFSADNSSESKRALDGNGNGTNQQSSMSNAVEIGSRNQSQSTLDRSIGSYTKNYSESQTITESKGAIGPNATPENNKVETEKKNTTNISKENENGNSVHPVFWYIGVILAVLLFVALLFCAFYVVLNEPNIIYNHF